MPRSHRRVTREDYQAAMASLDWQDRRRIELSSGRRAVLDDPVHAALAAERGRQRMIRAYWAALTGPAAAALLWSGLTGARPVWVWSGGVLALVFLLVVRVIVVQHGALAWHRRGADFDGLREVALDHRTRYRRRE